MGETATAPAPQLTVLEGGRREHEGIEPRHLVEVEGAWIEVQAVAHDAELLADATLTGSRRIQVAIAAERYSLAGQYAHQLELAAPLHGNRARRAEVHAKLALERLKPEPVA